VLAGFFLKPENLLGLVGVNRTRILERIEVPELPVDEAFTYPETINLPTRPGIPARRRAPVPRPTAETLICHLDSAGKFATGTRFSRKYR
jgi:hypothetical protein